MQLPSSHVILQSKLATQRSHPPELSSEHKPVSRAVGHPWKLLVSCLSWCRKLCHTVSNAAEDQVWLYLVQLNILLSESPTAWWRQHTSTDRWQV